MTTAQAASAGCDACNKSVLSLLLLRPSVIAKDAALAPIGSQAIGNADALVDGLVPSRKPTESRFVLRLLRAGFVHVYIASPPPGQKQWMVYRVSDGADLIAQSDPVFSQVPAPPACNRNGHNAAGIKLLPIPQAHKIASLWVAYSANLWSDEVKSQNAGNPKAMQQVSLKSCGRHSFQPTVDALKSSVVECALTGIKVTNPLPRQPALTQDLDFQFNSLAGSTESLVENLQRAAASHPKTKGLEMAVVLADPVGVATELNAIRLRRHELARLEIDKPENAHPLNSSNALMGLQKVMVDANLIDSFEQVSPLRTKGKFEQTRADYPAEAEWQPLTPEDRQRLLKLSGASILLGDYDTIFRRSDLGRVIYPDADERALAWAREQAAKTWKDMLPHYDDAARKQWLAKFEAHMKEAHYVPLAKAEADWWGAAIDASTLSYFANHFDENDPNDPLKSFSPGLTYAQESNYIYNPAPIATGPVLDAYNDMIDRPITSSAAVVLRALVGNQQSVIAMVHGVLVGDPGKDADAGGGVRDKTYDLLKGIYLENKPLHKYSWIGNAIARFSVGQLSAMTAGLMSAAAASPAGSAKLQELMAKVGKAQSWWGVQQAVDWVVSSALGSANKQAPKIPMLVTMRVDADKALAVLRARSDEGKAIGASRTRIKRQRAGGAKVKLSFLTDTDSLKAAHGDLSVMLEDPTSGSVRVNRSAGTLATASAGSAVVLSEEQFLRLYTKQAMLGRPAAQAVKNALTQAGADLRSIGMTVDGRLAIGSVFVQALGLWNGIKELEKAEGKNNPAGVRDAWYGIYDSTAGMTGGLLEMWAVAANARVLANLGKEAVARSSLLTNLRVAGNIAGAAGGVINYQANRAKRADANAAGDSVVAELYFGSAMSFGGTVITGTLLATGAIAEALVVRGIGGAAVEAIAFRLGAEGAAAVIGLSISGWGLVLLGAGLGFQLIAIAVTPTPLQRWTSRSYFGKDSFLGIDTKRDDMYAKGDWNAELKGLQEALKGGPEAQAEGKPAIVPQPNAAAGAPG